MQRIGPVVGVIIGVALILARKRFARSVIASQNAFWGFRFSERDVKVPEIVTVLVGAGFLVLSMLALLGVLKMKERSVPRISPRRELPSHRTGIR